jgi:hypothetical protein
MLAGYAELGITAFQPRLLSGRPSWSCAIFGTTVYSVVGGEGRAGFFSAVLGYTSAGGRLIS